MRFATILATLIVLAPPLRTGLAAEEDGTSTLRPVVVKLEGRAIEIKARLVALGPDTVTLLVKDRQVVFPKSGIERIVGRRRDSILDGALFGAAAGGAVCAFVCGQGLERTGQLPGVIGRAAVTMGAIGALFDALTWDKEVLYPKP